MWFLCISCCFYVFFTYWDTTGEIKSYRYKQFMWVTFLKFIDHTMLNEFVIFEVPSISFVHFFEKKSLPFIIINSILDGCSTFNPLFSISSKQSFDELPISMYNIWKNLFFPQCYSLSVELLFWKYSTEFLVTHHLWRFSLLVDLS